MAVVQRVSFVAAGVAAGGLLGAASAAASPVVAFDFSQVTQLAQGAIAGQNVQDPVPGFDLILLHRGQQVYHRAFGAWSLGRVASSDSSSKTLSGAVIMAVTDSSVRPFSLDTRLSELIPQFTGAKASITVRQAFAHTAAMRSNSTALTNPALTLQQAAVQIAGEPLLCVPQIGCEPGTFFFYAGISMHAAGAAAEVAAGRTWNTLVSERITGPLAMNSTRFVIASPTNPRVAGGAESTAPEFARMMEMLRRGGVNPLNPAGPRVLSQAAVDQLFTRQAAENLPVVGSPLNSSDYGVGVWLDQRDGQGRLIGALAGGARGFCSWIDFDDQMVGAIGTDQTSFTNIAALQYLIRGAAQAAVRAGPCLLVDAPARAAACGEGTVRIAPVISGAVNTLQWRREIAPGEFVAVVDGPTGTGSVISGARTGTLTITNVGQADEGRYDLVVAGACATLTSTAVTLERCVADFDCGGSVDVNDFFAFLSAYAAGDPRADLDGSGAADIGDFFAFLTLYSAGCA